ncbi:MAG: hypothetical protein FJ358_07915 [Thaumarchaeota archaeon]|nr:hypothetical protein [Nitrososphaerota archaeon]
MHPPCELMTETFLPAMRGLVAHELAKKGFSQSKISKLLGVTQPAVNQYLAKPQGFYSQKVSVLGIGEAESARYASLLGEDLVTNQVAAVHTLYTVWRQLLLEGKLSDPSRILDGRPLCDIWTPMMNPATTGDERVAIIEEVKKAVRMIEGSTTFPSIMPEVSVNLVMSTRSPKGEADVAAMPGRIVNVKGRARGLLAPEFGVSHHMARVLLILHSKFPAIISAMNIRYDQYVAKVLKQNKIECVMTDPSGREGSDPVLHSIQQLLPKIKQQPKAVIDAGGQGIEPITYIFGESALDVATSAIAISRQYSTLSTN